MAGSGSPISKSVVKWQVALAVGLPVAVGFGYWYLNSKERTKKLSKLDDKSKSKSREISIDGDISSKETEKLSEKSPLEKATLLKEEGNKLFKNGKYNEAIESYEKAIELCPESETITLATFYQNKAAAYEHLQRYEDVKEACTKALELNPKYIKALLRRAKACEQTQDLTQALEDIIAACILENFQSHSNLLSADKIVKELGRQQAKEAMAKRVPVMPSGSFIKTYFMSFTNDPINPFLTKCEGDTSRGFLRAVECFKSDDFESIIPACTEEINLTEAEALYKNEALVLRATFYILTGEGNLALSDMDMVINDEEVNPKVRVNALIKRASIHIQLEDSQSCMKDYEQAIFIDQNNSDIYHHRGQVHLLIDNVKEAADDFALASKLSPNNPIVAVQKCFTDYRLALFTKNKSAVSKLLQKFEDILNEYPDCCECATLYAQVLAEENDYKKADEIYKRAIKVDPKNVVLLVRHAMFVLQSTGDIDSAVNYINEALKLDDKCELAYETLGTIEVQRGNLTRAIEMFDKAIALAKTEVEMSHLFSLRGATVAQKKVTEKMNVKLTRDLLMM